MRHQRSPQRLALGSVLSLVLALAACGGGGGDTPPAVQPAQQAVLPAITQTLNLNALSNVSGTSTTARVEVPISLHRTSAGDTFFTVPITVGNTTLQAILDTGSPGLRVLPGALQTGDRTLTSTVSQVAFAGGESLTGVTAQAVVKVGDASTGSAIDFTLADTVGCIDTQLDCNARDAASDPQAYRFLQESGDSQSGFKAVLGVSLRNDTVAVDGVFSPLAQIGKSTFIIRWNPTLGTGRLIINPNASDDTGWAPYGMYASNDPLPNNLPSWGDHMLSGCLIDHTSRTQQCSYVMLDSGAPRMTLRNPSVTTPGAAPAGSSLQWVLYQDQQHATTSPTFSVSPRHGVTGNSSTLVALPPATLNEPASMVWGTMVFFQYDVMYSQVGGFIALRSH